MNLGLKVNADAEGFERIAHANPPFVEVWFNVNDSDRYIDLFAELKRRKTDAGLHFWGLLDGNISPNLAYPDATIIRETQTLMKRTIDIAQANGFSYVNVHPGAAALSKVNYEAERYDLASKPVETDLAIQTFLEAAPSIRDYAQTHDVVFTVETVPPRITRGWYNADTRLAPDTIYELPDSAIIQAAQMGFWVANDFVHTAANATSDDAQTVFDHVVTVTDALAAQTRLIHMGFLVPPYNGTDHHGSLTDPIFGTAQAVPNKSQIVDLLKRFNNRDDVWILVEPNKDHVKNYLLAKKLLELAEKMDSGSSPE